MPGIDLIQGVYGPRATVTASTWTPKMTGSMKSQGVLELELNDGKGWHGKNLSFLHELPELLSLTIIDLTIADISPIHCLHRLLSLDVVTYCRTAIHFGEFPGLEKCGLEWRRGSESVFECLTLRDLFVNRYDGTDAVAFGRLTNLEGLAILNAPVVTLEGLQPLRMLRRLRLANLKKLAGLGGIGALESLEELDVNTCSGVNTLDELNSLFRLKRLYLNNVGAIESLEPIDGLPRLERMSFYESTNIIDGDLSPLVRQTHLAKVAFKNRRHYSHSLQQFTERKGTS
jgi:hypothetical protein